jgi:pantoate--beta-alanine ligase
VLNEIATALAAEPENVAAALQNGVAELRQAGFAPDYLELRDTADLSPLSRLDRPARLLAAAHLGRTRLIDNIPVDAA